MIAGELVIENWSDDMRQEEREKKNQEGDNDQNELVIENWSDDMRQETAVSHDANVEVKGR